MAVAEKALRGAALWDEVRDKLSQACNRALGRPTATIVHRARVRGRTRSAVDGRADSSLDPISTLSIEELMTSLSRPLRDRRRHA